MSDKWPKGPNDPRYRQEFKMPKWNRKVTALDVPRLLLYLFPELTKKEHEALARDFIAAGNTRHKEWIQLAAHALEKYGAHGSLISGVVRDHFPAVMKESLRQLAREASHYSSLAWAHWKAAGRRVRLPGSTGRYGA
jgi:hypothetical protein